MERRTKVLESVPFLLGLTIVGGVLAEAIALGLRASGLREALPAQVAVSSPGLIAGLLLPYLVIRLVYRSSLSEFGVRWFWPGRPVWGWLIGTGTVVLVVWFAFWGLLLVGLRFAESSGQAEFTAGEFMLRNPLALLIRDGYDPRIVAYLVHMGLVVGFAEELFGRGLVQNVLDRRFTRVFGRGRLTVRSGTLVAAVLFAFWHVVWLGGPLALATSLLTSMTIVLVPSLVLCVVYEKTRSMFAVIVLHNVIDGGKFVMWYAWSLILGV